MSFRINGSAPTSVNRYIGQAQSQVDQSLRAIASGTRVSRAGDDAAGFAIAATLQAQISGSQQAERNAQAAQSVLQTAEGSLSEQGNILTRLRELAVNAASDTVGDTERGYLDDEFKQLTTEFDRIAKSTKYGGQSLLTGSGKTYEFQVGAGAGEDSVVKFEMDSDTTASGAGISGLSVDGKSSARGALDDLDQAMQKVSGARAKFGAAQNRLQFSADVVGAQGEALTAARSRVADVDLADETSKLARAQMQAQASTSVAAQANQSSARVLQLLG